MNPWGGPDRNRAAPGPSGPSGRNVTPVIELPAEDRASSPYTGYTRAHWEAAADALLAAVVP